MGRTVWQSIDAKPEPLGLRILQESVVDYAKPKRHVVHLPHSDLQVCAGFGKCRSGRDGKPGPEMTTVSKAA
jgi:hypothetical protein